MDKCRLLILDNSDDFPMALEEILREEFQIQYCMDGKEALSLLHSFQPDILLLELMVPGMDGISLLQAAADAEIHPAVLTFTRFYNDYMMTTLAKLGVSYWMIKPCDVHATAQRIRDLVPHLGHQSLMSRDPRMHAGEILFSLGFAAKHDGYNYLLDAIVMELHTPDQSVTKHLYPAIAEKYNCLQASVEHAIRTAIRSAWLKGDAEVWQQYFCPSQDGTIPRPTNATFISRIAQELRQTK